MPVKIKLKHKQQKARPEEALNLEFLIQVHSGLWTFGLLVRRSLYWKYCTPHYYVKNKALMISKAQGSYQKC